MGSGSSRSGCIGIGSSSTRNLVQQRDHSETDSSDERKENECFGSLESKNGDETGWVASHVVKLPKLETRNVSSLTSFSGAFQLSKVLAPKAVV